MRRTLRNLPWAVLRAGRAGDGRALGVLSAWTLWESLALRLFGVRPARPGGLLLFRVQRFRHRPTRLADGTAVARGALIVELHLANRRLTELRREPGYSAWRAVAVLREDLRTLATRIEAGELGPVVAIHGLSFLGAAGGRLGFEVRPRPHTLRLAIVRYFMAGVDAVYHPQGLERLEGRARHRWPVEVWLSAAAARRPDPHIGSGP